MTELERFIIEVEAGIKREAKRLTCLVCAHPHIGAGHCSCGCELTISVAEAE